MKCRFCGKDFIDKTSVCPYCGKDNGSPDFVYFSDVHTKTKHKSHSFKKMSFYKKALICIICFLCVASFALVTFLILSKSENNEYIEGKTHSNSATKAASTYNESSSAAIPLMFSDDNVMVYFSKIEKEESSAVVYLLIDNKTDSQLTFTSDYIMLDNQKYTDTLCNTPVSSYSKATISIRIPKATNFSSKTIAGEISYCYTEDMSEKTNIVLKQTAL